MKPEPSSPVRSRSAQGSGRRSEILAFAAAQFDKAGYSATTMADIARAAGVLPGSLYHHFDSKEELAIELLRGLREQLNSVAHEFAAVEGGADTVVDPMVWLVGQVMDVSFRNAAAVRLLSYEAPTVSTEKLRDALNFNVPSLDDAWMRSVADLGTRKSIAAGHISLLRFCLRNLSQMAAVSYPTRPQTNDLATQLCDIVTAGTAVACPPDEELDTSLATKAAISAMAEWPNHDASTDATGQGHIVAAARLEFARRGYDATTIRDIADAAGVRMGTLYRRIESKESILNQILQTYSTSMGHAIRSALETGTSAVESMDAYARVFVHGRRHFPLEMDIVKFGSLGRESTSSPFHWHYLETSSRRAMLERVVARGIEDGTVRTGWGPDAVTNHLRAIAWLPYKDHARTSERRALTFVRASVLRGLSPRMDQRR